MAKSTATLSNDFRTRLRSLEFTRRKSDILFSSGSITRRDIEQIYQGLFLESVAAFESFIEELFLGLLTGRVNPRSTRTSPKVIFTSRSTAMPIVFAGRFYDWLPYSRTSERAKHFFKNGHPFSVLTSIDINKTDEFRFIRNAIAHKSDHAKKSFEKLVIGPTALLPRERRVGAYLVGHFRSSPPQTRYENLIIDMAEIFEKICMS